MDYVYYVHVPFCVRKCAYCDFASRPPRPGELDGYVDALLCELELRAASWEGSPLAGFVGGGTPSLLPPGELGRLLNGLERRLGPVTSNELSVEVNPESVRPGLFAELRDAGTTRLSVGVQSLDPQDLGLLGRGHDPHQALTALQSAAAAGFAVVGADLIIGLPGQTPEQVLDQALACLDAGARHLSIYSLTLEPDTPLERRAAAESLDFADAHQLALCYDALQDGLADRAMLRYEVSNWARDGETCVHHRHVWRRGAILGLGTGAVSFLNGERACNATEPAVYVRRLRNGEEPWCERERLTAVQAQREEIMLGLRNLQGIDLRRLTQLGYDLVERRGREIAALEQAGLVRLEGERLTPLPAGMSVADALALRLWPNPETEQKSENLRGSSG